ncbi:MAG: SpoIIE family protein phosphatase [Cyclobacteriaceae bacterium]
MNSLSNNLNNEFPNLSLNIIADRSDREYKNSNRIIGEVAENTRSLAHWMNWFYATSDSFDFLRIRLRGKSELYFKELEGSRYLVVLNEKENNTRLINYLDQTSSSISTTQVDPTVPAGTTVQKAESDTKIMDALRIQNMIIPDKQLIKSNFRNFFVVHEQQDTVGGDFYWFKQSKDGFLLALIDCTGHSVEGAMTSMVCNSILNQVFAQFDKDNPSQFVKDFYKEISIYNEKAKGAMDYGIGAEIGMLYISNDHETVNYTSTGIAAYVKMDSKLQLLKSKKVMDYDLIDKFITSYSFDKRQIEEFYFFTDGLTDQFDAEDTKKFGYKGVEKLLQNKLSFNSEDYLAEIMNWKGVNMQYDDITLLGVAI